MIPKGRIDEANIETDLTPRVFYTLYDVNLCLDMIRVIKVPGSMSMLRHSFPCRMLLWPCYLSQAPA